jgi:hypothetical protein
MAFICKDCIEPAHKDEFIFRPLSHGPCENCHYTDDCVDIKGVGIDPKWRENVQASLAHRLDQVAARAAKPKDN